MSTFGIFKTYGGAGRTYGGARRSSHRIDAPCICVKDLISPSHLERHDINRVYLSTYPLQSISLLSGPISHTIYF